MKSYIAELRPGLWLANDTDTPEVTIYMSLANRFPTKWLATRALYRAGQSDADPRARAVPVVDRHWPVEGRHAIDHSHCQLRTLGAARRDETRMPRHPQHPLWWALLQRLAAARTRFTRTFWTYASGYDPRNRK